MKVCLVAQIENWRGGIQQYSQNYAENLSTKTDVSVIGYKSFFPKFLYPGKQYCNIEDCRKLKKNISIHNILKYYSIFSSFKAYQTIRSRINADVVDIQWCTTFHAIILIPLAFMIKKFSQISLVTTVHNVLPHELKFYDQYICKIMYNLSDKLVVHSQKMQDDLTSIFHIKNNKIAQIPHGICIKPSNKYTKDEAKNILGIKQNKVILYFGFVREYKGLDDLLYAFSDVVFEYDVALLIAGDFLDDKSKYDQIIAELGISDSIHLHAKYIKDEEVSKYFAAADFLVEPYKYFMGQSGVPPTAYYYSKPIIATNVGGLPEIVRDGYTGAVVEPRNVSQLAQSMRYFLSNPNTVELYGSHGRLFWENELSWSSISQKMLRVYEETLNDYKLNPERRGS